MPELPSRILYNIPDFGRATVERVPDVNLPHRLTAVGILQCMRLAYLPELGRHTAVNRHFDPSNPTAVVQQQDRAREALRHGGTYYIVGDDEKGSHNYSTAALIRVAPLAHERHAVQPPNGIRISDLAVVPTGYERVRQRAHIATALMHAAVKSYGEAVQAVTADTPKSELRSGEEFLSHYGFEPNGGGTPIILGQGNPPEQTLRIATTRYTSGASELLTRMEALYPWLAESETILPSAHGMYSLKAPGLD